MVLSLEVIDTVFRGMPIPDDLELINYSKKGGIPTGMVKGGKSRVLPLYNCWYNMLQRCLVGSKQQEKIKAYIGCKNEFNNYQEFAEFCYTLPFFKSLDQFNKTYELDKDIKGFLLKQKGVYSKETICMLPKDINCFLTCVQFHNDSKERSTKGAIVYTGKVYKVRTQDVCGDRERKFMSESSTPEEAYQSLCDIKQVQAKYLADKWKGKVEDIVIEFLNNFDLKEWEDWSYQKQEFRKSHN